MYRQIKYAHFFIYMLNFYNNTIILNLFTQHEFQIKMRYAIYYRALNAILKYLQVKN